MLRYIFLIFLLSLMLQATSNFKLSYLKDTQGIETIERVSQMEFTQSLASRFSLGYLDKSDVHCFAIDISSDKQESELYLYFTNLFAKDFSFYYQDKRGKWQIKKAGYSANNRSKSIWTSKPTLKFLAKYNQRIYVKIKSDVAIFGEFLLFDSLSGLIDYQSTYYLFFALFFGVLLMTIVINLFLFITLKEKIYGYYLGYLFFFGSFVFMVNSLHSPFATPLIIQIFRMCSPIALIFFILFSKELLEFRRITPSLNKILNLILVSMVLFIVMIFYSTAPWYGLLAKSSTLLYALLIIGTALAIYHRVNKARIYLFALILQLVSTWMMVNMYSGILENNDMNQYSFMLVTMINFMLFTLILANKINEESQKKLKAEEKLLKQQANYTKALQKEVFERTEKVNHLLNEKEALLKEVYHRVKNNFHMIISLLWMEKDKQKNQEYKKSIEELINRIKSMSLIHQYLLNMESHSQIEASEYIEHIVNAIVRSYSKEALYIEYKSDKFKLLPDEALRVGVIINELLTNAIKHHNKKEQCTIELSCKVINKSVQVLVQDNGEGFDTNASDSGFGLNLIDEFADKLQASTKAYTFKEGTEYTLIFPILTASLV